MVGKNGQEYLFCGNKYSSVIWTASSSGTYDAEIPRI